MDRIHQSQIEKCNDKKSGTLGIFVVSDIKQASNGDLRRRIIFIWSCHTQSLCMKQKNGELRRPVI